MASTHPLEGKVALVTGAGRGIGWAVARDLAAAGADLVLNGVQEGDSLTGRAREITQEFGVRCLALPADVADAAQVAALFSALFKEFKALHILVNNAGVLDDARLGMIREESLRRVLAVNLEGAIRVMQGASRLMRRSGGGGAIVNMASIIGVRGNAGQSVYAASKGGLIAATLSAAKELGVDGIRVNAIAPGVIETDMTGHLPDEVRADHLSHIALGRFGSAEDVARAVRFLVSDDAAYITGQILGVDGGMVV
ncbi:MAG: SDR family NAD(P)-dependent oxidoreductase [Magnetospiraceae bacterium]